MNAFQTFLDAPTPANAVALAISDFVHTHRTADPVFVDALHDAENKLRELEDTA